MLFPWDGTYLRISNASGYFRLQGSILELTLVLRSGEVQWPHELAGGLLKPSAVRIIGCRGASLPRCGLRACRLSSGGSCPFSLTVPGTP